MKYCREWRCNGSPLYLSGEMIYVIKYINKHEIVITNEQIEKQWVREMIGDFMRVELEKPEWRHDNLNRELLYEIDPKMMDKVIEGHNVMRRIHKKIMKKTGNNEGQDEKRVHEG